MQNHASNALELTRLCAWYMNQMVRDLELGNQAEHFNGENPNDWAIVSPREVRVLKHSKFVAEIHLDSETQVEIIVPDDYMLIRSDKVAEYDPIHHGIIPQTARDFKGERLEPTLVIQYSLEERPLTLQGERQHIPESTRRRKPTLKRQFRTKKKLQ